MGEFSPWHWLLVLLVFVLLFYSPKKLGELGKGLGEGIRNFKSSIKEGKGSSDADATTTAAKTTTPEEKK